MSPWTITEPNGNEVTGPSFTATRDEHGPLILVQETGKPWSHHEARGAQITAEWHDDTPGATR